MQKVCLTVSLVTFSYMSPVLSSSHGHRQGHSKVLKSVRTVPLLTDDNRCHIHSQVPKDIKMGVQQESV